MALNFVSIEMLLLGLLVVNLVIGLFFVMGRGKKPQGKGSRSEREAAMIADAIRDYFRRSGVEVDVGCTSLDGSRHYTAFIESEPMKRFRLSHIIEATLSDHVLKTCKLELEKIYWRFPIKEGALRAEPELPVREERAAVPVAGKPAPAAPAADAKPADDYINEGLEHYKHLPKVEAEELSWESFQEASSAESQKKI